MKLKSNSKISIIVILLAIASYFVLVNAVDYNFATLTSPVGFDNIGVASISSNDVIIVGNTAVPVICKVEYGTNGSFLNSETDNDTMNMPHTEHSVEISNLESDTKYNYRFVVEYENKVYRSDVGIFQTPPSNAPMSLLPES